MKDQFANYVVQKVLETCDDQQRELILSRIKVHLDALKKYTYGKHIVARVEKLIVTGGEFVSVFFVSFDSYALSSVLRNVSKMSLLNIFCTEQKLFIFSSSSFFFGCREEDWT